MARQTYMRCTKCGSENLRRSSQRTPADAWLRYFGIVAIRCGECRERFYTGLVRWRDAIYAKCPRCYRLEVGAWNPARYRVPLWQKLLLLLGGRPCRCNACRNNFVSFRPVKANPGP